MDGFPTDRINYQAWCNNQISPRAIFSHLYLFENFLFVCIFRTDELLFRFRKKFNNYFADDSIAGTTSSQIIHDTEFSFQSFVPSKEVNASIS